MCGSSIAIASRIGGQASAHAHIAFISGLHTALLCAGAAALLAAVGVTAPLSSRPTAASVDLPTTARAS
jgi:hypothetical protein